MAGMVATVDFSTGSPVAGSLDVRWIHGSRSTRANTDPKIQVHRYDPHTLVLRQSKAIHFEAPFLFLLFGNERALLLDTGATADPALFPLRSTVDALIEEWLTEHPRPSYELVVAHTHAHSDHVAGDPQFTGRPATRVVAPDVAAVQAFFGFTGWPTEVVRFDLGGRVLDVTGIPGHHETSIAIYDPWTGILFTGDTVLPGRFYVHDFPAFRASLDRLVQLAADRPVTHVLGCHIEMRRTPGRDYPIGARYQPDEPPLQLTVAQLAAARDAAVKVADHPGVHVFDDFIIFNGPCRAGLLKYSVRLAVERLRGRLANLGR